MRLTSTFSQIRSFNQTQHLGVKYEMDYEPKIVTSPRGLSQEQALVELQDHPSTRLVPRLVASSSAVIVGPSEF